MNSDIKTVGVVGAGQMGIGIAHVCGVAGYDVCVTDISQDILDEAKTQIEKNLARLRNRGRLEEAAMALAVNRISYSAEFAPLSACNLVIEAATENVPLKQKIFAQLEALTGPETILASNTSSIPLKDIGAEMGDTRRLVGAHFWNPPHLVPLVEVSQLGPENLPAVQKTIRILAAAA